MSGRFTRRDALKGLAGAAVLPALPLGSHAAARAKPETDVRPFRVAHLTDIHVQPERSAADGLAECLRHVQALTPRPDLIVTGGDLIMDGFDQGEERTRVQWDLFTKVWERGCTIPTRHCLGNHDIWGWHKPKSKLTGNEPRFGKTWAMEVLGLERLHYAFQAGGWKFVVLDSVRQFLDVHYIGGVDDEQLAWLEKELNATPAETPVAIVSHIPLISGATMLVESRPDERAHIISGSVLMHDAYRTTELLRRFANVRLSLSGHIHIFEDLAYSGVRYVCSGAVSGAWWEDAAAQAKARAARSPGAPARPTRAAPGYSVVDLHRDGRSEIQYVEYGWRART